MKKYLILLVAFASTPVLAGVKSWEFGTDDPQGQTAYISQDDKHHFGFRCFDEPEGDWITNTAYFVRVRGHGAKCQSPAKNNVLIFIGNKSLSFPFECKSDGPDDLYYQLSGSNFGGTRSIQLLNEMIAKSTASTMNIAVSDVAHFGMTVSLKNAKIRSQIEKACKKK